MIRFYRLAGVMIAGVCIVGVVKEVIWWRVGWLCGNENWNNRGGVAVLGVYF